MSQVTEQQVLESLSQIIDPDLRKDIVTLGFVRDLEIDGGSVSFRIVLTTPACPVKEEMEGMAREFVREKTGEDLLSLGPVLPPPSALSSAKPCSIIP